MKKLFLFIILSLFLISFVSATCTVTFDKASYDQKETISTSMSCSENTEKNTAYTLTWINATGSTIQIDTGTTPPVVNTIFVKTFTIPSDYVAVNGTNITATLTGTDLEGSDSANISAGATSDLIITGTSFTTPSLLGKVIGIIFNLEDANSKLISNALCNVYIIDNNGNPIEVSKTTFRTFEGIGSYTQKVTRDNFAEGTTYRARISCMCGANTSTEQCLDEDGTVVANSHGSSEGPFVTDTWLTVNTLTEKLNYAMKDEIFICANVTNVISSSRIPMEIYHQVRCSSGTDNNNDLDRSLIIEDSQNPDERGISTNTTQMQCKKFKIPESDYLQGKTSECYASTTVWVLNQERTKIVSYATTSPVFNITSTELNIDPDWQWIGDKKLNSIVNLSDFANINGTGTGDIDVRISDGVNGRIQITNSIELFNLIENITVKNTTTTLIEHVDYELEFLEDGQLEIEIRNVALTKTGTEWYNITLEFYDLGLREVEALEGIENKTGTFHLDVNCPSTGTIGSDMSCIITAYVEDSQTVQKEVDFTCYISDGLGQYSSVNFNQMITQSALSMSRSFAVPSTFTEGTQYVLQCTADYYNLGSRRDSFYDTFTASTTSGGSGSSGGGSIGNDTGRAPITGGAIDEGDGEDKDDKGILNEINPLSPDRNWAFMFVEVIILICLFLLTLSCIKKKRKEKSHYHNKSSFGGIIKKAFAVIIILLILILFGAGIWYGYSIVKDSFSEKTEVEQTTISEIGETSQILLQGNLIKSIFLIFIAILIISLIIILFTAILLWILFKLLNVRGEIKFGHDHFTKSYYEDRKSAKLQQKLNQIMLKNEIKRETTKEDYKVRKMSQQEFADFIKKKNSK